MLLNNYIFFIGRETPEQVIGHGIDFKDAWRDATQRYDARFEEPGTGLSEWGPSELTGIIVINYRPGTADLIAPEDITYMIEAPGGNQYELKERIA